MNSKNSFANIDVVVFLNPQDKGKDSVLLAHTDQVLSVGMILLLDKNMPDSVKSVVVASFVNILTQEETDGGIALAVFPSIVLATTYVKRLLHQWNPLSDTGNMFRFDESAPIHKPQFSSPKRGQVTDLGEQAKLTSGMAEIHETGESVPIITILQALGLL
jgi:hypothetical protein